MRQTSAEIRAIDAVGTHVRVRFDAPDMAPALKPGHALLARSACAYLRHAWWPCAIDDAGFSILLSPPQAAELRVSDRVDVLGPIGRGFQIEAPSRNLLLVAAGSSELDPDLGPLLPLVDRAVTDRRSVTLAYAAPSAGQAYPVSALPPAIEVIRAIDADLIELLSDAIAWADQVFACGPDGFISQLADRIRAIRFPAPRGFAQALHPVDLVCGVGACGACRSGSKLACVDGPVFELGTRPDRS